MKKLLTLLILVTTSMMASESNQTIQIPKTVEALIPSGYTVLNFTKGNLDRDGIDDAILILAQNNERELSDMNGTSIPRPLYILIGDKKGNYKKVAENNNTVLGVNDGGVFGDPFSDVTIKNGYFSVEHYGGSAWRWTHIITYKYNTKKKAWFLHKDGGDSFHSADPEKVETKVATVKDFGIVKFEEYNIFE